MTLSPGNPMVRALALILGFEVIVFGLGFPGMVIVSDVRPLVAGLAAGGAALLALLAAGLLRHSIGWPLAWLAQIAGVLLGILTPMMYVAAGVFAFVFAGSFVLGRRLEGRPPPNSPGGKTV